MQQFEINGKADLPAKLNQLQTLAKLGFQGGLSQVYLAISRESLEQRTNDQNSLMWPLLTDISQQVEHHGSKYTPEQWKDLLTSSFEGVTQYAPNLDGTGLVAFGARTSKYNKKKMSEFIEFIYAAGSERGVKWSDKSEQTAKEAAGL